MKNLEVAFNEKTEKIIKEVENNKSYADSNFTKYSLLISELSDKLGESEENSQVSNQLKTFQKKLEDHVDKLNTLNAFLSFCFEFQFDAKELCGAGLAASKVKGFDVNAFLGLARTFVEGMVENKVKPILTQYGLVDAAKATDIDEVSISLTFPKYENGIAHVVKLPGFSKAFCEKFLK